MQVWRDSPTVCPPSRTPTAIRPAVLVAAPSPAHTGKLPSQPEQVSPVLATTLAPGPHIRRTGGTQ